MAVSNAHKHLTREERHIIETGIRNGSTKSAIASTIGKNKSTIGKEIKERRDRSSGACNCCEKYSSYHFNKFTYKPDLAHNEYIETLVDSRQGVDLTTDEVKKWLISFNL